MTAMKFVCDLDVPRTDDATGIPMTWVRDDTISYGARGLLARMLVRLAPGETATDGDLEAWRRPDDPPLSEVLRELSHAGYLVWLSRALEGVLYELVHPDRLGPLPA